MTDHKTVEEVIRHSGFWEDPDNLLLVEHAEDGSIRVAQNLNWKFVSGVTLLEALYKLMPDCDCDEYGSEEEE